MVAKPGPKLEAVSPRLKRELIHPSNDDPLVAVQFSPDGKQIIAGSHFSGTVVVWDVVTGKQLSTLGIDKTQFTRDHKLFLSPDWQTLFDSRNPTKYQRTEHDGKEVVHCEYDGDVRAWDLMTGKLLRTFKHQPPRGVFTMKLSPDGTKFVTTEAFSGIQEPSAKEPLSMWDVKTGQHHPLPEGRFRSPIFSPDSKSLVLSVVGEDDYHKGISSFDTATGKEKWSIPIKEKTVRTEVTAFSPDGKLVVGDYKVYDQPKQWDKWQGWLKWWDAEGREVASFFGEKNATYFGSSFSPDGQTLVVAERIGEKDNLHLIRVADRQLVKTLPIGERTKDEALTGASPVFSPDGRWIAVLARRFPRNSEIGDAKPQEVLQPRIHLIDVPTGTIAATLVAPPAKWSWSACFSPDGRTLATGGHGKVLLWDVTKLPGAAKPAKER